MASTSGSSNPYVLAGANSGLTINLHPLPILNISEHHTRARLTATNGEKLIGALLGTQANREVSIINSFELTYAGNGSGDGAGDGDVQMDVGGSVEKGKLDAEFLENRKDQFKQVFPTLEVVGWYSVGEEPGEEDVKLHEQFAALLDTPIFLLFNPSPPATSTQDLPITVYETSLNPDLGSTSTSQAKFVALEYGIETGEAERIAVDGVARGGMGDGEDSGVVGSLTTQRNAIRMLYERIGVLSRYIQGVIDKSAKPDYSIIRQVASVVATLPTMDSKEFKDEMNDEYADVQLTTYLTSLTKQLNSLAEYADKHHVVYPGSNGPSDDFGRAGFGGGSGGHYSRKRG